MATLLCRSCNAEHPDSEQIWRCTCGGLLDLEFDPEFPISKIEDRIRTLWRYREAIPIESDENIVTLSEGFTPLLPVEIGGIPIQMKHDHLFLSGSFKDRGATVLLSRAKELGIRKVVEDSSGNAGCAISAYSAEAGIDCDVFVPDDVSPEKAAQIEVSGGNLHRIPGGRKATAEAALEAARVSYFASHCWNPYFFHGTKTFAFEICEQLGWQSPDVVILPVGNGTLVLGADLGFRELLKADVIDRMPRIIGVQAEKCCPLYHEFHGDDHASFPCLHTSAEGIAIPSPLRGPQIIEAIRESKGSILKVTEEEIIAALRHSIERAFIIEPTAAATIAGVEQFIQTEEPNLDEVIVSTFSGHGSNTAEKIMSLLD